MTPDLDDLARTLAVRGLERHEDERLPAQTGGVLVVEPGSAVLFANPGLSTHAKLHLDRLAWSALDEPAAAPWHEVAPGALGVVFGSVRVG